ncbi:MAG TPA: hypothetical protein VFR23_13455 [Jiangellaceae bacterium]|nr:hypothetical protein [Jiangellaceae bacterium]
MKTVTATALDAAERYLLLNARLIDRRRFDYHFRRGPAASVRAALAAYANTDGGFGNALEPDLRGFASQPQPVEVAFHVLDETTSAGEPFDGPLVRAACDYLMSISASDGGVPFVLPSVRDTPAAPWWQTPDDPPGNLNPTAALVGLLHKHSVDHPFVEQATAFCWPRIEALTETTPYETYPVLTFLDHVPDRERAEAAFERLAPLVKPHVTLDPEAPGEAHFPLDYAPRPDGFGRRMFDDGTIEQHLDALVNAQVEDGSWTFNWPAWTPIVRPEWNGFLTVKRLLTLRAYGRLVG